jgi:hypothetical protein
MRKRVDVLILVEHVARELDIACALRYLGKARHGLDIEIASLVTDAKRIREAWKPRIVATPFFYSARDWGVRDFLSWIDGATWVNLAFEQVLSKLNWKVKRPRDAVARDSVIHVVAGDSYGGELLKSAVPPENIATLGSLTCAQYVAPYRAFFEQGKQAMGPANGLDPTRPWVLFPENFGAAFFSETTIRGKVTDGYDRKELEAYCAWSRASMEATVPWCWEVARRLDVEMIIRPRPAVPRQEVMDACTRIAGSPPPPNLHFIKDGAIREWILACDVTVSNFSTSLIEATVAEKPAWLLLPSALPDSLDAGFFRLLPSVASAEEFADRLERRADWAVAADLREWARKNLMAHGDPLENATELFASICRGRRDAPVISPGILADAGLLPDPAGRRERRRLWRRMRKIIRQRLGRAKPRSSHEADAFSREQVHALTSRWSRILG